MPKLKLTWARHKEKWGACDWCELHLCRKKVVLFRGKIPCTILFVGEAPGAGEDVLGKPFVGPAGQLLDELIERAEPGELRLGFTNVVACIPKNVSNEKGQPDQEAIEACQVRLKEMVALARPKYLVGVGKIAESQLNNVFTQPVTGITHPAAILRSDYTMKGVLVQRVVTALSDLFEEVREETNA